MTRLSLVVLIVVSAVFAAPTEKKSKIRFEKGRMEDLAPERKAAYHSHLKLAAQTRAKTSGKQFLFAFPNSHINANDTSYTEQLSVVVTNTDPSQTASITITSPYSNFTTITDTVAPGQSKLIPINPVDIQANYNDKWMEVAVLENKGLLLTSNVPVEVVAENVHTDGGSGDNYDLIPTCQLGNAYRTVSDEGSRRGQNSTNIFVVVALQSGTSVKTQYTTTWNPPLNASQTASFVSKRWQTDVHIDTLGGNGALISAAVCGYGYSYAQGCSHESIMMTPISSWGTQFPVAKLRPQTQYEILVIGANDGTDVRANGDLLETIDDGWYLIVWNDECDYIETSKPALVVVVGTSSIDGQSAPFFVQVPPPEQYSTGSTQFATGMTTTDLTMVNHYVRLTTTIDSVGKLAIDGYYPNPLLYMRAGKSNFYYVDQLISNGTHVVNGVNTGVKFSTTVYGYGPNIGYAYTPGLELPANGDC